MVPETRFGKVRRAAPVVIVLPIRGAAWKADDQPLLSDDSRRKNVATWFRSRSPLPIGPGFSR
jgi:hypothetical protein